MLGFVLVRDEALLSRFSKQSILSIELDTQDSFEQSLFILINSNRLKLELPALMTTTVLMDIAEAHSLDMANRGYLAHISPDGLHNSDRMKSAGYAYSYWGEVIAGGPATPAITLDGWLNSPKHKAVLLDERYREMGIGFVYDDRTKYGNYWTVIVAVPEP